MIDMTNPAGRLYNILAEAKKQIDHQTVKQLWSTVLGVDDDDVTITKAIIALYSLSQEIQELIKLNDKLNHNLYLSSFNSITRVLIPINTASAWGIYKVYLTEETLTRLQFCAEELSQLYSEESLPEDDLKYIITKTDELFDLLYKGTLPDALRLSLLEEVERIRSAINMYKIKGAKGLKEALQGTIGAVVTNAAELKAATKDNGDIIKRVGELIDKLDSFSSRALKIKNLISSPIKHLMKTLSEPDNDEIDG